MALIIRPDRASRAAQAAAILDDTMKVTSEHIPERQVVLNIEVDQDQVERSIDQAYRRLVRRTKVPGFRPGKAPRPMLERFLGRDRLMNEALDDLVPEVYRQAIEQEGLQPIDQPDLEITSIEPQISFKATVPLAPTVKLGDYKSVRLRPPEVTVEPSEVDAVLEDLRRRYATIEPRDRPVQDGDIVRADVRAWVDDRQILDEKDAQFAVRAGGFVSLPGFAEALIGRTKGGPHEITIDVAEDYEEPVVAGKRVRYEVDIKEVKEERLPELEDGFAKTVGEGFESLAELRAQIERDLREAHLREAEERYQNDVLAAVADEAEVDFPPVMVEREVERILHDRFGHGDRREAFEQYLQQVGRSEREVRDEVRPEAAERLIRSLVLSEVSKAEGIEATDEDIDKEIETVAGAGARSDELRAMFGTVEGRDVLRRSILTRRTLERLAEIARQPDGAPAAAPTEDAAAAPASPAKAGRKTRAKAGAAGSGDAGKTSDEGD
ncbi:MAG TPA: trigger factor [Dehalococcoidia bacterium]|nr:trigger factor [Dehalococcoidia bacterium]